MLRSSSRSLCSELQSYYRRFSVRVNRMPVSRQRSVTEGLSPLWARERQLSMCIDQVNGRYRQTSWLTYGHAATVTRSAIGIGLSASECCLPVAHCTLYSDLIINVDISLCWMCYILHDLIIISYWYFSTRGTIYFTVITTPRYIVAWCNTYLFRRACYEFTIIVWFEYESIASSIYVRGNLCLQSRTYLLLIVWFPIIRTDQLRRVCYNLGSDCINTTCIYMLSCNRSVSGCVLIALLS